MASRDAAFQIERSWAAEPLFYRAPAPPNTTPREYQHAAVEYALNRKHCLIGDAPGLGKSAEGVLLSNALDARRTLVVCPASLRLNWEREIWHWSTIPNVRTYPTLSARDGISPQAHYQIISYDLLRNPAILCALVSLKWDHLILDEAHYLKDPKGNLRTQAICAPDALPSVVGRITMLSGTPTPNQPIEAYNAIRLMDWEAIDRMSLDGFREHFYEMGSGFVTGPYTTVDNNGNPVRKYGAHWSNRVRNKPRHLDELREILRSRLMVRRLTEHVLPELPKGQWHIVPLAPTAAMRKALKHPGWKAAEKMHQMDPDAFNSGVPIDGAISTARRELGEAKAPDVCSYIEQLFLEGRTKIIVGAWHKTVLAYMREKLAPYGVAYMDGSTSARRKQSEVDRFQNDPDVGLMLGQMMPLGEGWTLTAAQDAVLPEPHWVPGRNDQFLRRLIRHGQVGDHVTGHLPIVPDTLDERILHTAIDKDIAIHKALDDV